MTNEQAKFILSGYRPNGQDTSDPSVVEALKQAKLDPQLADWFAKEQAHAASVAAKLQEIAPPPDLRSAILAGSRVSGDGAARGPWARIVGYAAAACLLAALGFLGYRSSMDPTQGNRLAAFAIRDAHASPHGSSGTLTNIVRTALADDALALSAEVPIDYEALLDSGCRTVDLDGQDVIEVCFRRSGARVHLYAARMDEFPAELIPGEVKSGRIDGMNFVNYTCGELQYILVSEASLETLLGML